MTANNDGTLSVVHTPAFVFGSKPTRLVNVDQLLFKRAGEDGYAAFEEDNSGQISYIFHPTGTEIAAGYEKLSWYQTFDFQLGLLAFFVVVFLSACIIWPLAYLIRRPQARRYQTAKQARLAALIAVLLCALNLAFLIGLALTVWLEPFQFLYGLPSVAIALLCLPIVTTGMTVGLLFFTGLAWRNNYWSALGRLYYLLITLAALAFIPFLLYWNLLGFLY